MLRATRFWPCRWCDPRPPLWDVGGRARSPFLISVRFHWPIQGPQALASTVPPTLLNTSIRPSRSIVALICSLPGVMVNGTCVAEHSECHQAWHALKKIACVEQIFSGSYMAWATSC